MGIAWLKGDSGSFLEERWAHAVIAIPVLFGLWVGLELLGMKLFDNAFVNNMPASLRILFVVALVALLALGFVWISG